MYNEAEKDYVYVIAGGAALEIIRSLEDRAGAARQELSDYVARFGVTVTRLDGPNNADIDYGLSGGNSVPEGWTDEAGRSGRRLKPDLGTDAGREITRDILSIREKLNVHAAFNAVSHDLAPSSPVGDRRYSFERVGGKTIIACPRQREGDAVIPPDSTVISYLEYITLKEQASPTPPPRTSVFKNSFNPE